jgi:iron complex transport system substrate-binding protein
VRAVLLSLAALLVAVPAEAAGDLQGSLPQPPRRIVSLVPSVTEIIYALGGEGRLAGVTDFCDWPPAARAKPSVGGMLAPNLEVLVALRPDLVIATHDGNRQETFDQLRRLGIPVLDVSPRRLAEVEAVIVRLGALTGREETAPAVAGALRRRVQAVEAAVRPFPRPKVLYVLWPEPLLVPGRDGILTELIERAGGTSITAGERQAYPRFSLEAVVARAPEVIVLASHGADRGPVARAPWERLGTLPAVRAGRVHTVDGSYLHRYGPRLADGLEMLARAIHPEAFR